MRTSPGPFTNFVRKDQSENEESNQAFLHLKEALTTPSVLSYPEPGTAFILDTDASDQAIGAVFLSQRQEDKERIIAYMSKAMNVHDQVYCIITKELLAIVTTLRTFHANSYGQELILRTDNAPVSWMKNSKKPTGQTQDGYRSWER